MALIDKASLLMVPSTYEAGTLYNVLPSGNRAPDSTDQNSGYDQTRADFTFDRGTDHGATRIGSDGLIKKYRENLILQSNQFDTTWAVNTASVTSGQIGYDGSSDAWLLNKAGANKFLYQTTTFVGVQTISIYAKAGSLNWLYINCGGGVYGGYFDLSNGVTGSNIGTAISTKIEAVGNTGWWRCEVSGIYNGSTSFRVYPADGNNDTSGTSGNIYIQNAQLESGLVATDYLDSGATTGKAGVLIDLPRINYDANGENGSLLLEPSRQQLIQYSEYFGDSSWTKTATTSEGGFLSPDGNLNASKLLEDNTNSIHRIYQTSTVSASPNATISVYVKYNGRRFVLMRIADSSVGRWYDLIDGVKGGTYQSAPNDSTIEPVGNDWYRITISHSVSSVARFELWVSDTESNSAYQGDVTKGVYLYGAQLEPNASYATSYIPNHGESGGVTRAADSCSVTGVSDVIGQTEGTFFLNFKNIEENGTTYLASIDNGTSSERIEIFAYLGDISVSVRDGGVQQVNMISSVEVDGSHKIAFAYKQNDFALYIDGSQISLDTSGTLPTTNQIKLYGRYDEANGGGAQELKQAVLFNERLTNSELATLTTL